jgi:hypothetical protein
VIAALTGWQIVGTIVGATVVAAGWMICAVVVSREPSPDLHSGATMGPRSLTSLNGAPFTVTEQPPATTFTVLSTAVKPPPVLTLVEDCGPIDLDDRRRRRIHDEISQARPFDYLRDSPEIGGAS